MRVPFGHKKVPGKVVYINVPEPPPPTWLMPMPEEFEPRALQPLEEWASENVPKMRTAIFERSFYQHYSFELDEVLGVEIGYTFKAWV